MNKLNLKTKEEQEYLDNHVCALPFYRMEVGSNGHVRFCCASWTNEVIGDVTQTSIEEVWKSPKAIQIRESMQSPSPREFIGCRTDRCEIIKNRRLHKDIVQPNREWPVELEFNIDRTCNLHCPSCRQRPIHDIPDPEYEEKLKMFRQSVAPYFKEPHDREIIINIDGSGEVFASRVYRTLFDTEPCFSKTELWPNLKFIMQTNGVLLTEKLQNKYANFVDRIDHLWVSIDAGNESSYNKTRRGGDWNLLWQNMDAYYERIKNNPNAKWTWNLIIQLDNFESIPELVERAHKYHEKLPGLSFTDIVNWGTYTAEQYDMLAVHRPSHPLHKKFLDIINVGIVKNYPKRHYR